MKSQRLLIGDLAGIEYAGLHGITASCVSAITCLLNGGEHIEKAYLITCGQDHAFVLSAEFERSIAIKAGFASGYGGEGPSGLSATLAILREHNVKIEEYIVPPAFMDRLNCSCLRQDDLDFLRKTHPVHPRRWYQYMQERDEYKGAKARLLLRYYPASIPFALVDSRILDVAVNFSINPDSALLNAYRRLEGIVRERTGLLGEGHKLFSAAFQVEDAPLKWDVTDRSEAIGRAQLFTSIYLAFRNARAHREIDADLQSEVREFLLVNELYRLEAESMTQEELAEKRFDDEAMKKINAALDCE